MEGEDESSLCKCCPKLKSFVRWMKHEDRPYELHDDFLATLTRDSYLKFRHMDAQSFSASSPSHHEPSKLKTSFSGEFKHQTTSESQTALNNFKKGTKRDASVYPIDRIPSTTPGEEPPRDARDSGSARSHSTHLETSSSYRP